MTSEAHGKKPEKEEAQGNRQGLANVLLSIITLCLIVLLGKSFYDTSEKGTFRNIKLGIDGVYYEILELQSMEKTGKGPLEVTVVDDDGKRKPLEVILVHPKYHFVGNNFSRYATTYQPVSVSSGGKLKVVMDRF